MGNIGIWSWNQIEPNVPISKHLKSYSNPLFYSVLEKL